MDEEKRWLGALVQAQKEYKVAHSCFEQATEPEIIDEAIYLMAAARQKYTYFLKQLRASHERREKAV